MEGNSFQKRPVSLSFDLSASPLPPQLVRNGFLMPLSPLSQSSPKTPNNGSARYFASVKRKQFLCADEGNIDEECLPSPAKQFMMDPDVTENILENGYFKDESVWQDDNWYTLQTNKTSPEEKYTNQQIFLSNFSAGIQGTPIRTPTTPGGSFPIVKRRMTPACTPSSPMTPMSAKMINNYMQK